MLPETVFSLRLMFADYVLRPPTPLDIQLNPVTGERNKRVPVIRVFGSTAGGDVLEMLNGQTTLLHIHRVFPYLYIPYDGQRPLGGFIAFLARELDLKLGALMRDEWQRRQNENSDVIAGKTSVLNDDQPTQHVFRISLVSGTPMYGYYSGERAFLQVSFYNPRDIKRAARLLLSGKVGGTRFQPYEAHIPFVLQFKIDYNLHGMNFVHTHAIRFRKVAANPFDGRRSNLTSKSSGPRDMKIRFDFMHTVQDRLMLNDTTANKTAASSPSSTSSSSVSLDAHVASPALTRFYADSASRRYLLPKNLDNKDECYRVTTTCDLECDVLGDEIINKMELEMGFECNPGIAFLWKDENRRRSLKIMTVGQKLERLRFRSTVPDWDQTWKPTESEIFWAEQLNSKVNMVKRRLQTYNAEVYDLMQELISCVERMSVEFLSPDWCNTDDDEGSGNRTASNNSYVGSDTTLVETMLGVHLNMSSRALGGTLEPPQALLAALPSAASRRTQLPSSASAGAVADEPLLGQLGHVFTPSSAGVRSQALSPASPPNLALARSGPVTPAPATVTFADNGTGGAQTLSMGKESIAYKTISNCPNSEHVEGFSDDDDESDDDCLAPLEHPPTLTQLFLNENDDVQEKLRSSFLISRSIEQNPTVVCTSSKTLTSSLIVSRNDMKHIHQQEQAQNAGGLCLIKPSSVYESRCFPILRKKRKPRKQRGKLQTMDSKEDRGALRRQFRRTLSLPEEHDAEGSMKRSFYADDNESKDGTESGLDRGDCYVTAEQPSSATRNLHKRSVSLPVNMEVADDNVDDASEEGGDDGSESQAEGDPAASSDFGDGIKTEGDADDDAGLRRTRSDNDFDFTTTAAGGDEAETDDDDDGVSLKRTFSENDIVTDSPIDADEFVTVLKRWRSLPSDFVYVFDENFVTGDAEEEDSVNADDNDLCYTPIHEPPSLQQVLHRLPPLPQQTVTQQPSPSPSSKKTAQPLNCTIAAASKRSKVAAKVAGGAAAAGAAHVPTPQRAAREQKPTVHDFQHLITMSVEVFALPLRMMDRIPDYLVRPDPCTDPVVAISYTFLTDYAESVYNYASGLLLVDYAAHQAIGKSLTSDFGRNFSLQIKQLKRYLENLLQDETNKRRRRVLSIDFVNTEDDLMSALVELVQQADPDLLVGYEIQCESWGYLIQRATALGRNLMNELSRAPRRQQPQTERSSVDVAAVKYMERKLSEYTSAITGRVVVNLWRLARREITLYRYSLENVVRHVLQRRIPAYSGVTLARWFYAGYHTRPNASHAAHIIPCKLSNPYFARFCDNLLNKSLLNLLLLDKMDVLRQTAEQARLYGIQFHEVLTRGSQFRVESMMLRLAKPLNYVPVSPSTQQLMQMMSPEGLPLIMEPESRIYNDPVLVLDFQSLYPSMVIAYNYCFSTCLGKIDLFPTTQLGQSGRSPPFKFGCTQMTISAQELIGLQDLVNISPAGVAFVKPSVRKGVLPRMLDEILGTRIMVKKAMGAAANDNDEYLERVLNARQLALKLIANVTFGYASANFSGRMPCAEISDSIIERAKETLQRAIRLTEDPSRGWGARVVYGDTDSMFVLLKGRTKLEAFEIGEQIARAVSADNPEPVKLKFEKVYLPCVLMSKKRYVGWKFESAMQTEGIMDAKGIETVRRDQCPLMARTLRGVLEMLFRTTKNVDNIPEGCDLAELRRFVMNIFQQLIANQIPVDELVYAKEFRGSGAYKERARVPANEIAKRMKLLHPALEPRVGERVPYIVSEGVYGDTIIKLVMTPEEFCAGMPQVRVHARYYGYNVIAQTLNRVLNLFGVDAKRWWFDAVRALSAASDLTPNVTDNLSDDNGNSMVPLTTIMNPVENELSALGFCNVYMRILANRVKPEKTELPAKLDNADDEFATDESAEDDSSTGSSISSSSGSIDSNTNRNNEKEDDGKMSVLTASLWRDFKSRYVQYLRLCSACMGHRGFGLDESSGDRGGDGLRLSAVRITEGRLRLASKLYSHECVSTACPVLYERVKSWKQCELFLLAFLKSEEAQRFFQQINVTSELDW